MKTKEQKPVIGDIEGRNGNFDITGISIRGRDRADGKRMVDIEGIGKRGRAIRGGITVEKETFKEAALRFFGKSLQQNQAIDKREVAAILAGLRLVQRTRLNVSFPSEIDEIFSDGGNLVRLNDSEIDTLCYRINTGR